MTTFTEKVEELLTEFRKTCFLVESMKDTDREKSLNLMAMQIVITKDKLAAAHQAEISRRKEEWEKLRTQHEVGDIVGHYEITDRFKKVGKNTKYRVICKLCGAPMFRYSNRFKTNHKDCPAINKIKGEYNG